MPDFRHYVPILRWKRGEKIALKTLSNDIRQIITPLIEPVPDDFTQEKLQKIGGIKAKLNSIVSQIGESWAGEPFFIDLDLVNNMISTNGQHLLEVMGIIAGSKNLKMIPVTSLNRDNQYNLAVKKVFNIIKKGICIRLKYTNLGRPDFNSDLDRLLNTICINYSDTDLIVDFQYLIKPQSDFSLLENLVENLQKWRSFTLSAGAFPKDLTEFKVGIHQHERMDWLLWHSFITTRHFDRLPSFSDYTIQHPLYKEPPKAANVSASIRYLAGDHWIIMRGESLTKVDGPGHAQYPAEAQLLCKLPEFSGTGYSTGDDYLYRLSLRSGKAGTPELLIRAGINHHITLTANRVATFVVP